MIYCLMLRIYEGSVHFLGTTSPKLKKEFGFLVSNMKIKEEILSLH